MKIENEQINFNDFKIIILYLQFDPKIQSYQQISSEKGYSATEMGIVFLRPICFVCF